MTMKKAANCFQLIFIFMSAKVVVSPRTTKKIMDFGGQSLLYFFPGPASAGSLPLRPGGVRTVLVSFLVNIHRVAVHRVCSLWVWFRIRQDDWFLLGVADGGEIRYHHPFGIVLLPVPLPWYDDDGHARRHQVFECSDVVVGQPDAAMADAPSHRPGRTGAVNANLRRPRHAQSDKPRSEHPFLLRSLPLVVGVEPVGTVIYILHGEESFGRAVVPLLVLGAKFGGAAHGKAPRLPPCRRGSVSSCFCRSR